jgi:hypothetical protein
MVYPHDTDENTVIAMAKNTANRLKSFIIFLLPKQSSVIKDFCADKDAK